MYSKAVYANSGTDTFRKELLSYAPLIIQEMTQKGVVSGNFSGAVLLADIIGFTSRFERMKELGAEGAELISREVSSTLSAVSTICAESGGFPVSFAGDAVTIVFPGGLKDASSAVEKINLLAGGEFLPLRSSIGEGQVVWDAIPMNGWTFYSFQGTAVRQALLSGQNSTLEQKSWPGQKYECIPEGSEDLPANGFISPELFADGIKNEFRQVINVFLSLENRSGNNCPREFQELVLNTAEEVGGFVSGLEAGKEDYHILVVFGAPVSMEDDTRRADFFLQQVFEKSTGRVKAGVASGLVFSGLLKTQLLESYTVLGPSVNLAARLHSAARWNSVYSGPIFNRVSRLELRRSEEIVLKGISLPVQVVVLSPWQKRTVSSEQSPPFLGRSELLDSVESRLRTNSAQVLLTGISGIGKTRFATELCNRMSDVVALSVNSEVLSGGNSDINTRWLGAWIGFDSQEDGLTTFREKLYAFVDLLEGLKTDEADEIADELLRAESVLAAMAGLQWGKSLYQSLDPAGRFQNTVSVTAAFIRGHCLLHKTVMIFDDIQWMAPDSVELLSSVLGELGHNSVPILLLARPGLQQTIHDLGLTPEETKLPSLSREDCRIFLEWSLSREPSEKLLEWFYLKTEGIPFFMEQYALMLTSATDPPDTKSFPGNIHALLVARLDRLEPELKKAVLTASVLGRVFNSRVLQGVMPESDLRSILQEGVEERVWERTTDGLFNFVHLLLRETAYNLQLHSERLKLHRISAEVMERMWSFLPEKAAGIAYHLEKSEQNNRAALWYFRAGKYSFSRRMLSSCLEHMKKVLLLSEESAVRLDAHEMIYEVHISTANLKEAEKAIDSASQENLTSRGRARILLMRAKLATNAGEQREAEGFLEGLETSNPDFRPRILSLRGRILMLQAKTEEAMNLLLDVYDEFKDGSPEEELLAIKALGNASGCMLRLSKIEEAVPALKRVLAFAIRTGDLIMETLAVGNLALTYKYLSGRHAEAISMTKRHLELARRTGNKLLELQAVGNLGALMELEASTPEVFKLLEKAVSLSRKYGGKEALSISLANLGRTYQKAGKLERALKFTRDALEICRENELFLHQIDYAYESAHILMDMMRLQEAEDVLDEIEERSASSGYGYSIVWARGRLLQLQGRKEDAVKLLTDGLKNYSYSTDRFNLLHQLYLATGDADTLEKCLKCGEDMLKVEVDWHLEKVLDELKRQQCN